MKLKNGVSFFTFHNDKQRIIFLEKLISKNENIILFNLPIKCTFDYNTYFKNKKTEKMKGIFKIFAKLYYRFITDIQVKIELETYSETSNKKFMCIKDFINDKNKLYVIGTMGFSYKTVEHILRYILLEKKEYNILVIDVNNSLNKDIFHKNIKIEQIRNIVH